MPEWTLVWQVVELFTFIFQKTNDDSLTVQALRGLFNQEHCFHKFFHSPTPSHWYATFSLSGSSLTAFPAHPMKFHLTDASEVCVTHPAPQTPNSGCQKKNKLR